MEKKIEAIEKLIKQIEKELDFDKVVSLFGEAAGLVKDVLKQGNEAKGRVMEIIRELDEYVEKEIKTEH